MLGSPFWVLIIIRHLIFRVPQKRTTVLTTTHMFFWPSAEIKNAKKLGGCKALSKPHFSFVRAEGIPEFVFKG